MSPLRRLLRRPAVALAIVAAALMLRLLVPAGYMPVAHGQRVLLLPCPGAAPASGARSGPVHAGMAHGRHDPAPAGAARGCAFADLAPPAIGGADPVQLAALLLFVLAVARVAHPAPARGPRRRLRPPAHAPPVPA